MALGTYIRNVYAVDVLVAISVSVTFFVYIPGMIWMMCCTSYVFVVVHKVKIASSAQNKGGLPTKYIYIWNGHDQEQRFENHAW